MALVTPAVVSLSVVSSVVTQLLPCVTTLKDGCEEDYTSCGAALLLSVTQKFGFITMTKG